MDPIESLHRENSAIAPPSSDRATFAIRRRIHGRLASRAAAAVALLAAVAAPAAAGPNSPGTLILHEEAIAYTSDYPPPWCEGAPASCEDADHRIDDTGLRVWRVFAAFPDVVSPRLRRVAFGITYAEGATGITITDYDPCPGAMDGPLSRWPASGSGTVVEYLETQSADLISVYWFAGECPSGAPQQFQLTPHPTLGWTFQDDSTPPVEDVAEAFGSLGFFAPGTPECPLPAGACCRPDGTCTLTYEEDCPTCWLGDGTACVPNRCGPPSNEHCFYVDFDDDDDPWTIRTSVPGSYAEYAVILEAGDRPPVGEWHYYDVETPCQVVIGPYGLDSCLGAYLGEPDFDPAYVDEVWLLAEGTEPCDYFLMIMFKIADDAVLCPGERYFLLHGGASAGCSDQYPPNPECLDVPPWFRLHFNSVACDFFPQQMTLGCPQSGVEEPTAPSRDTPALRITGAQPVSASVRCAFGVDTPGPARLVVCDVQGRVVRTLHEGHLPAGRHQFICRTTTEDGVAWSSGVYWLRLESGSRRESVKFIVAR